MTQGAQDLVGKPAPSFTLPNYDGESFEFKPGASGLPTALLFYPESGTVSYLAVLRRDLN